MKLNIVVVTLLLQLPAYSQVKDLQLKNRTLYIVKSVDKTYAENNVTSFKKQQPYLAAWAFDDKFNYFKILEFKKSKPSGTYSYKAPDLVLTSGDKIKINYKVVFYQHPYMTLENLTPGNIVNTTLYGILE